MCICSKFGNCSVFPVLCIYKYIYIYTYKNTQHRTFRKGFIASTFGCNDNGEQNSNCDEAASKNHLKTNQQLTHQIFASWIQHIYSYISEEVVCLSERDLQILNSVSSCTHIYEWNVVDWAIFVVEALACLEFWEWWAGAIAFRVIRLAKGSHNS